MNHHDKLHDDSFQHIFIIYTKTVTIIPSPGSLLAMSTKVPSPRSSSPAESIIIGSALIIAIFWAWKFLKCVKLEDIEMNLEFTPRLKLKYQKAFIDN
jgi:hypothetical protein